jgi:hypothetical protein
VFNLSAEEDLAIVTANQHSSATARNVNGDSELPGGIRKLRGSVAITMQYIASKRV